MPLNSAIGPSCSTMYDITSKKLLNGMPFLAGGGRDCRPTFATISGCVAIVARALDIAPSTADMLLAASHTFDIWFYHTERLPRPKICFASKEKLF